MGLGFRIWVSGLRSRVGMSGWLKRGVWHAFRGQHACDMYFDGHQKVFHALLNAFPILWFDWGIQGAKLAG